MDFSATVASIVEAPNTDGFCCTAMCRRLFLEKAQELTWKFVNSIATEGFIDSIKLDLWEDDCGEHIALANGNHRLVAAILLGIDVVPVEESWNADSNTGPAGWPSTDGRKCIHHETGSDVYVMSDPDFAAMIIEVADALSDCDFDAREACMSCCDLNY